MAKKQEVAAQPQAAAPKEKKPSKSKIACVECGTVKAVRPDVFNKRVVKFGSEEKLRAGYLCLACRPKVEKAEKPAKAPVAVAAKK